MSNCWRNHVISSAVYGCQLFFFLCAPGAQSCGSPYSSHACTAVDDSSNDFNPCTWFPQFLDELPLTLLWKLFKGQCVVEIATGFLKHLQANYQLLYNAIRDSWL